MYDILWHMGKLSGCHQMPSRSFFIKGKQFPVCARCTGAFFGYIIGALVYPFYRASIWLCLLFCAIMFIDWLFQRLDVLPSTNIRRFITGTLCGFAIMHMYIMVLVKIFEIFKLIYDK